jgi:hypothetical protein
MDNCSKTSRRKLLGKFRFTSQLQNRQRKPQPENSACGFNNNRQYQ